VPRVRGSIDDTKTRSPVRIALYRIHLCVYSCKLLVQSLSLQKVRGRLAAAAAAAGVLPTTKLVHRTGATGYPPRTARERAAEVDVVRSHGSAPPLPLTTGHTGRVGPTARAPSCRGRRSYNRRREPNTFIHPSSMGSLLFIQCSRRPPSDLLWVDCRAHPPDSPRRPLSLQSQPEPPAARPACDPDSHAPRPVRPAELARTGRMHAWRPRHPLLAPGERASMQRRPGSHRDGNLQRRESIGLAVQVNAWPRRKGFGVGSRGQGGILR
jgi:hypothetical protein